MAERAERRLAPAFRRIPGIAKKVLEVRQQKVSRNDKHDQKAAVAGEANWQFCTRNGTAFPVLRANYCDRMGVPADKVYDPKTNRKGVRGVCDFTRKGVAVRAPDTWLAYSRD